MLVLNLIVAVLFVASIVLSNIFLDENTWFVLLFSGLVTALMAICLLGPPAMYLWIYYVPAVFSILWTVVGVIVSRVVYKKLVVGRHFKKETKREFFMDPSRYENVDTYEVNFRLPSNYSTDVNDMKELMGKARKVSRWYGDQWPIVRGTIIDEILESEGKLNRADEKARQKREDPDKLSKHERLARKLAEENEQMRLPQ